MKDSKIKRQTNTTAVIYLIGAVLVMGTIDWWFEQSQPQEPEWQDKNKHLPNRESLQLRINQSLSSAHTEADRSIGADVERIIDPQAMEAKLSGLTKTVTLSREPNTEELESFFQMNRETYREDSKFAYTQLIFPFAKYGGLAITKARDTQNRIEIDADYLLNLENPPQEAFVSSLQLDDLYGQGYGDKLVNLIIDSQDAPLPCWSDPITSKIGAHIICFKEVTLGAIPELESIRSQVTNDWRYWVSEEQP